MTELTLVVARLAQHLNFTPPQVTPEPLPTFTLRPSNPVDITVRFENGAAHK
jgi:hypothetical protein